MVIEKYTPSQERTKKIVDTGRNILLSGKPGTGKTELLRDIYEEQTEQGKKVLVTASTGLAASNLEDGRTIHSALRWAPRRKKYDFDYCTEALKEADILIIDEVSMLETRIINHLYNCLNHLGRRPQLIMAGDFYQLPPVTLQGYERRYPFEHPNWQEFELCPCILEEVVRQEDAVFKQMLERAMRGDTSCIDYFNENTRKDVIEGAITLCTKNKYANEINKEKMASLPGKTVFYWAEGNIADADFTKTRIEKCFAVKSGMRVMALRNDALRRYQNGSLGTVIDMGTDWIKVKYDNGTVVDMHRATCSVEPSDDETEPIAIQQFPLCAAYAISIHKSQGQTFDAVNIMAPNCWDPGQLYVALSRARSIKGIHLMEPLTKDSLKVEQKVIDYYRSLGGEVAMAANM